MSVVLGALAVVVGAGLTAGPSTNDLGSLTAGGAHGTLQAAGLLSFAFSGYARIATQQRALTRAGGIALTGSATKETVER